MAKNDLKEYRIWKSMKSRCYSACHKKSSYQQKGIIVCDEWKNSFDKFYKEMGPILSNNHSLDRINNDGNYCKENCRWATAEIQTKNRGNFNLNYEYNGKTLCLKDWAKEFNIKYTTLYLRIYQEKLTFEEAINREKRANKIYSIQGHTGTIYQLCEIFGIKPRIVYDRVHYGWDIEKAIITPKKIIKKI